jgi:hypothetical protein
MMARLCILLSARAAVAGLLEEGFTGSDQVEM